MPLRLRLALLFAVGTALVITVAGLGFLLQLRVSVDASLDTGLRSRAASVARELASEPAAAPQVGQADQITQVLTPAGQLLASSAAAGPAPLLDPAQRMQALAGEISFIDIVAGDRSRLLATPATAGGRRLLVVVGTGTDVSDAAVDRVRSALLLGGPPAVLLAGFGAWLLAGAALRPVERMRREAAAISEHDSGTWLAVPDTRDEIAALGATMNALLARLQGALARERGFVADAGHELRTPLAILRTELDLAARPGRSREDLIEAIGHAGEETDRLIRLAEDLLLLARADNGQPFLRPAPLSLPDLLAAAARGAAARAAPRQVGVEVHGPTELHVRADADRLRQAVDNLLDNAIRYAPSGGVVELSASTRAAPGGSSMVRIEVADRGPGFSPHFLPHAFERFQRADAARSRDDGGAGLGLAIVRAVAIAHGGDAIAANRPGGGAVVMVDLAADTAEPLDGDPNQPHGHHRGAGKPQRTATRWNQGPA
ncbi:sensor histidine kinase [Pseudonocardia acidicola]|uniref:histidine kinase n=1 Tax=Pseudonocardia acidicola TaxID=2724939 RepID=A0ABX1SJF2_9PSEU|nr:ATP-binding protein [Pseudonocardia acidicola]NMI01667.1 HAMP domain-containing protein [Pseudonocardia acidicola]